MLLTKPKILGSGVTTWLIENISPLQDPTYNLRGLTWAIYWYYEGDGKFPTTEISFDKEDDATLFKLVWT